MVIFKFNSKLFCMKLLLKWFEYFETFHIKLKKLQNWLWYSSQILCKFWNLKLLYISWNFHKIHLKSHNSYSYSQRENIDMAKILGFFPEFRSFFPRIQHIYHTYDFYERLEGETSYDGYGAEKFYQSGFLIPYQSSSYYPICFLSLNNKIPKRVASPALLSRFLSTVCQLDPNSIV